MIKATIAFDNKASKDRALEFICQLKQAFDTNNVDAMRALQAKGNLSLEGALEDIHMCVYETPIDGERRGVL